MRESLQLLFDSLFLMFEIWKLESKELKFCSRLKGGMECDVCFCLCTLQHEESLPSLIDRQKNWFFVCVQRELTVKRIEGRKNLIPFPFGVGFRVGYPLGWVNKGPNHKTLLPIGWIWIWLKMAKNLDCCEKEYMMWSGSMIDTCKKRP
jgi:hypothetical protein